jgi:hypothetical protein
MLAGRTFSGRFGADFTNLSAQFVTGNLLLLTTGFVVFILNNLNSSFLLILDSNFISLIFDSFPCCN